MQLWSILCNSQTILSHDFKNICRLIPDKGFHFRPDLTIDQISNYALEV